MGVKPGYKRTEVGVIPEEWEAQPLATLTTGVSSGKSKPMKGATTFPVFGSTGIIGHTEKPAYEGKAILVARVGANAGTLNIVTGQYGVTDNTIIVSTSESVLPDFLWRALQTKRLNSLVFGSGQPLITGTQLKVVSIQLPSLDEQRAIATALSDVDALLTQLDRLIAKKRDIKQATMQQLLTGKTRLPGFGGEWQVRHLGEISHIKTGARNNEDKTPKGRYPFFVRSENVERIDSYSHDCEAILVPGEGRIGDIFHYIEGRFDVHQRVYAITQFAPNVSGRFIHFYMALRFGPWAMQNTVKATVDSLRLPTFQSFELKLPPTREEQTAIATLLSDLDAELSALDARRDKTRALKLGMMQELLTGRTRLV